MPIKSNKHVNLLLKCLHLPVTVLIDLSNIKVIQFMCNLKLIPLDNLLLDNFVYLSIGLYLLDFVRCVCYVTKSDHTDRSQTLSAVTVCVHVYVI